MPSLRIVPSKMFRPQWLSVSLLLPAMGTLRLAGAQSVALSPLSICIFRFVKLAVLSVLRNTSVNVPSASSVNV